MWIRVRVLKVFDGDGFLARVVLPDSNVEREVAVRCGFIDAPEMAQPGGLEAREFLSGLITDQWLDLAILVKMDTGGIVDSHGRIVAVPYLQYKGHQPGVIRRLFGGATYRNVELEMVLNGWAWVLDRYGPDERYFEALDDARLHRRGIWALDGNVHPWEFKKLQYRIKRQRSPSAHQPDLLSSMVEQGSCPKEGCSGHLVERRGRFGTFYGCSNFPNCRYNCSELR